MKNQTQYNKLIASLKIEGDDDLSFLKKLNANELELLRETIENLFKPNFLTAKNC